MKTRLFLALMAIGLSAAGTPALASASSGRTVAEIAAANFVLTVRAPRIEDRATALPEIGSLMGQGAVAEKPAAPVLSALHDKLVAELKTELDALKLYLRHDWADGSS